MNLNVFYGILIPFIGTSAGAACVVFYEKRPEPVGTALSDRVCCGCHGSSICVESADPCT